MVESPWGDELGLTSAVIHHFTESRVLPESFDALYGYGRSHGVRIKVVHPRAVERI